MPRSVFRSCCAGVHGVQVDGRWRPVAGAGGFVGCLDPVAVVAGSFDGPWAGAFAAGGDQQVRDLSQVRGGRQPSPEGGMSAVPVAVRRIRRRALAKEIRSGSRSAAAEAFAISALIAWWTMR